MIKLAASSASIVDQIIRAGAPCAPAGSDVSAVGVIAELCSAAAVEGSSAFVAVRRLAPGETTSDTSACRAGLQLLHEPREVLVDVSNTLLFEHRGEGGRRVLADRRQAHRSDDDRHRREGVSCDRERQEPPAPGRQRDDRPYR